MKFTVLVSSLVLVMLAAATLAADDLAALLKKGDALDKQLKNAEALAVYLDADKASPNNAEVLHRVAKEYGLSMDDVSDDASKRERGMKALDFAKRAVAADGNNATAHLALAVSYGRLAPLMDNKTKIAYSKLVKEQVDRSLKLDDSNDLAYFVLGDWNYELANLNSILRMVASAIYGSLPAASNEDAVECFKKAIALNPTRVGSYVELGRTYAALKQSSLAAASLKKALSMPNREKDDDGAKQRAREALQKL
jgi:tetratricopeptide (TPR) repeat protein